ncbi:hypothetical protein V5O48_011379 [Marasmius crinis-equi]|uniref:Uncharacterized protein n=1 Tax=Marasmius crinis-equi TaxID=585013 RepID=A0ABR3F5W2_9AGAR
METKTDEWKGLFCQSWAIALTYAAKAGYKEARLNLDKPKNERVRGEIAFTNGFMSFINGSDDVKEIDSKYQEVIKGLYASKTHDLEVDTGADVVIQWGPRGEYTIFLQIKNLYQDYARYRDVLRKLASKKKLEELEAVDHDFAVCTEGFIDIIYEWTKTGQVQAVAMQNMVKRETEKLMAEHPDAKPGTCIAGYLIFDIHGYTRDFETAWAIPLSKFTEVLKVEKLTNEGMKSNKGFTGQHLKEILASKTSIQVEMVNWVKQMPGLEGCFTLVEAGALYSELLEELKEE